MPETLPFGVCRHLEKLIITGGTRLEGKRTTTTEGREGKVKEREGGRETEREGERRQCGTREITDFVKCQQQQRS